MGDELGSATDIDRLLVSSGLFTPHATLIGNDYFWSCRAEFMPKCRQTFGAFEVSTVFFHAANDHSMKPPAPKQGGLARDELRAECALSAVPIPGIEASVQERLLSL